jgi:hypothetical protein
MLPMSSQPRHRLGGQVDRAARLGLRLTKDRLSSAFQERSPNRQLACV